jgi:ABC-2 type transport system permease protein
MLTAVLQKEFRSLLSDARLRWSAIVSLGLFVLALITGVSHYQNTNRLYTKAQEDTYRQWLDQGEKNPHSAAHYGLYAYKPVPLLAIFDRGMDDYLGNAVWLEAHNQNEVKLRTVQDAGTIGRFGALTVGFIWQFILPLLIILLAYNSMSKEFESGTLRMLLSTQISTFSLLGGKALGILKAVLLCLYLPMLLLLSGALYWAGGAEAFARILPSLGLAAVLYSLFYAVFVVLSVSFSAWLRSSGLSLAALLGVWAIGAFLLPRISGSVAMSLHPTPSALDFTEKVLSQREKGLDGQGSYEKFQEALKAKALRDYGVDSLSQLPVSFAGIALQASEDRDWKVYDLQYGALFRLFQAQNALLEKFNLLSPILAMRDVSRSLAGTDLYKHLNFTRQAETHRRLVAKVMNTDQKINGIKQERDYKAGAALWQKVPQFQYQNQSLGEQLQQQWFSLLSLGCWLLGLTFCLYRSAQTLHLD